jgi:predicted ATPase
MISKQYAIDVRLKRAEVPSFDSYPFSLPAVRHLDVL